MLKKITFLFLFLGLLSLQASDFSKMGEEVKTIKLENGAKILVIQDDSAPIIHCVTIADVGGVCEEDGKTGIAHFLEHLAFKGTKEIGTKDYQEEKVILAKEDAIFDSLLKAKKNGNDILVSSLQSSLDSLEIEASKFVINNEFSEIYTKNGGRNFNAATSQDFTYYQVSLPSNKIELWFAMEKDRFSNPIFREFYKERKVILEEKKLTHDNSPYRLLLDELAAHAFSVHPYKISTIGLDDDIHNITRADVNNFFNKYYGAQNLTFILYGDVDYNNIKRLSDKYISQIPAREKSLPVSEIEPKQTKEKRFNINYDSNSLIAIGYHVPNAVHVDTPALEAFAYIIGQNQTSPLYKQMVKEKKEALFASSFLGLPGTKYPSLLCFLIGPNPGTDVDSCINDFDLIINEACDKYITEEKLTAYKKNAKKRNLAKLDTGIFLPIQVGISYTINGDNKAFFNSLDKIDNLTVENIKQAVKKYVVNTNRTIGILQKEGR